MTTLSDRFAELGPWVTRFEVDGASLGGSYSAERDDRLDYFFRVNPKPGRVLELGCLEGGHSLVLARRASHVVAVDARADNIERARFVQGFFGTPNISFVQADLEAFPLASLGEFDVVFNVGLLYHLPEPWRLLEQLALLAEHLFLWTHVAPWKWRSETVNGYRGVTYPEGGVADPLSGMSPTSFWPTRAELLRMLADCGFGQVEVLRDEPNHPHGPAILLAARSWMVHRRGPSA